MSPLFMKLLEHAQHLIYAHFLRYWVFILLVTVMTGWFLSRHRALSGSNSVASSFIGYRITSNSYGFLDYLCLAGFLLFVGSYVFVILYKEDFACVDCDQLMDYTVAGRHHHPPIWIADGRFFPLMFQEFNVLRFFTRTPAGFHSLAVVQLLILLLVLFTLLRDCSVLLRVLVLAALMLMPSFVIPFTGLIYPERNVLLWLSILMLCLERSSSSRNPIYLTGSLVATHFLLYYKEPIVVIVVVYAVLRLLLELRPEGSKKARSWREYAIVNTIPIGMIVLASVYTVFFSLVLVVGSHTLAYVHEHSADDRINVIQAYFQTDWLLPFFSIVLFYRFAGLALFNKRLHPFWDSLAMGVLCYFLTLLGVGIYRDYYVAPVDLVALLYLMRTIWSWQQQGLPLRAAAVAAVFVLMIVHNSAYSALRVIERKEVILLEQQLVDFLRAYRSSENSHQVNLYFPFCNGYRLMELSSYLNYRGIPILGMNSPASLTAPPFVITSPEKFSDSRCVRYKEYACFHVDTPLPHALLIIAPDDLVLQRDIDGTGANAITLLKISSPAENAPVGRLFRILYRISFEFRPGRERPQPWWQLYVFQKSV